MRLLVVDDHSLIREAVRHMMQALAKSVTVLTAADCDEGFAIAERESELEVLLLDFNLRGAPTGVQAIRAWRQRHPALPVVVLSSADDRETVLAAMAAGAAGFIPKASSNEVMVSALRLVLAGGKYLPAEVLARDDGVPARAAQATSVESLGLSPRQLQVLELIAVRQAQQDHLQRARPGRAHRQGPCHRGVARTGLVQPHPGGAGRGAAGPGG